VDQNSRRDAVKEKDDPALVPAGMRIKLGQPCVVDEHKSFVDSETGFVFTTKEIDYGQFLWGLLPRADGVLSWYKLPDGSYGTLWRYRESHRVPYKCAGKQYFFVIPDIDYKTWRATVRVDSVVPVVTP